MRVHELIRRLQELVDEGYDNAKIQLADGLNYAALSKKVRVEGKYVVLERSYR